MARCNRGNRGNRGNSFFIYIGNFGEISYINKNSPRDAPPAVEKFALRHRSRAKCVRAHIFLI